MEPARDEKILKGGCYLEYVEFLEEIRLHVQQRISGKLKVSVNRVLKNNRKYADSMTILGEGDNIAPAIYLNPLYEQYKRGSTIDEIADEIAKYYGQSSMGGTIDLSFYSEYEKVRDHLACKLINYEKNRHILEKVPYYRYLDLAVVYYCRMDHPMIGKGNILVQNAHLKLWDVEAGELHDAAVTNTVRLCPYELIAISDMLENMLGVKITSEEARQLPMYVLTNTEKYFGAVNIIFDSILEAISERLDSDFYVLPSSIHECMIVPVLEGLKVEDLHQMVHDINTEHVALEEILGESVYCYRRDEKKLSIVWEEQ